MPLRTFVAGTALSACSMWSCAAVMSVCRPLLAGRSDDMRWQYLQHVVHARGSGDAALHTELGLELAAAARAALAALRHALASASVDAQGAGACSSSGTDSSAAPAPGATGAVAVAQTLDALLRDMAERLPIAYAPNTLRPAAAGGGQHQDFAASGARTGAARAWGRSTGSWREQHSAAFGGAAGAGVASLSLNSWDDVHMGPLAHGRTAAAVATAPASAAAATAVSASLSAPWRFPLMAGTEVPRPHGAQPEPRLAADAQPRASRSAVTAGSAAAAAANTASLDHEVPGLARGSRAEAAGYCFERSAAPDGWLRLDSASGAAASRLFDLRCALVHHLQASQLYDPQVSAEFHVQGCC